jgi:hypothetical protein
VLVNGEPLRPKKVGTCALIFRPDAGKGNTYKHEPRGDVDEEGNYFLITANQVGAPPGWYKVGVRATEPRDSKWKYAVPKEILPPQFADPEKSGLSVEVVEYPNPGQYDLKVTRK